jgi:hypothetical protein
MTLTVRLPPPLEEALDKYSTEHGLTKSHVVQEALATYLVQTDKAKPARKTVSSNYAAFKRAGLLGCAIGMEGTSATKEVVRKRIVDTVKARRG